MYFKVIRKDPLRDLNKTGPAIMLGGDSTREADAKALGQGSQWGRRVAMVVERAVCWVR